MKKYMIIFVLLIGIIISFFIGIYIYKIKKIDNKIVAEKIDDECTFMGELEETEISNTITTNNKEEKTSPNCVITLKVYHKPCTHLIETKKKIENVEVNITEEELRNRFKDWEIQEFTPTQIVLYKEVNNFCNEHFLLKEENGYINIYKLDENDNETFYKGTDISTEYLAQEDLESIKNGLKIYTEKELNKYLEDFE